jgi:hypothetical protein
MALDGYIVKLDLDEISEMIRLLRISSNNLNQIAKKINATGSVYGAEIAENAVKQTRSGSCQEILARLFNDSVKHEPGRHRSDPVRPRLFLWKGEQMAATRLIAMHPRQGRSVAKSLGERTDYAKNPEKTEKGDLVTTYQCDPFTVDEEFMLQKRQYNQITGKSQYSDVIAYQIRQSFKPGEVTADEANRIGYELALRFTKGKYSFIVATHTDRAHIHNHVVFNSTSIDGTRKFKDFWRSGLALQKLSDLICLEHGLSVIERKPYDEREKRMKYPVREGIRGLICQDIDEVLSKKPKDFDAFLEELKKAGYEIKKERMWRSRAKARNALFVFLPFLMVSRKPIFGSSVRSRRAS